MNAKAVVLTEVDRKLLGLLQEDLPLCADPWGRIGKACGLSTAEVLQKLADWRDEGLIRKIGPSINPRALGWFSTLCGTYVPPEKLEQVRDYVGAQDAVTHCYVRDNAKFNLWFTIIAPSEIEAKAIAEDLRRALGLETVASFPASQVFKIKAVFNLNTAVA